MLTFEYILSIASLSEFGKHIPPSHDDDEDPKPKLTAPNITSSFGPEMLGDTDPMNDPMMKELEDMFGEEFAKQVIYYKVCLYYIHDDLKIMM